MSWLFKLGFSSLSLPRFSLLTLKLFWFLGCYFLSCLYFFNFRKKKNGEDKRRSFKENPFQPWEAWVRSFCRLSSCVCCHGSSFCLRAKHLWRSPSQIQAKKADHSSPHGHCLGVPWCRSCCSWVVTTNWKGGDWIRRRSPSGQKLSNH